MISLQSVKYVCSSRFFACPWPICVRLLLNFIDMSWFLTTPLQVTPQKSKQKKEATGKRERRHINEAMTCKRWQKEQKGAPEEKKQRHNKVASTEKQAGLTKTKYWRAQRQYINTCRKNNKTIQARTEA